MRWVKNGDKVLIWKLSASFWIGGYVPDNWMMAVIVMLYKGQGNINDFKNYRRIGPLRKVGKEYDRTTKNYITRIRESLVGEDGDGVHGLNFSN